MPRLLHHLVDETAQRAPEAVAVRCDGASLSYGALARQANGLARVLREAGCQRRDRVAVLLSKSPRVAISFYGVLAAGAVLVPIDPKSPVEQITRILRATGARFLVTEPGRGAVARAALGEDPGANPATDSQEGLNVDCVLGLSEDGPIVDELPGICSIPWSTCLGEATDRPPEVEVIDLDPCYVLHTSGSTGVPKLIQHTHRSALSFVEWAAAEYALTAEDRLSNHSSHHTCFATFDYYAAARVGAATVLLTPATMMMPASLSALLARERVSVWYSVPTALVQLSLRGNLEAHDLSALRWVLFAGETYPEKHLRRLMGQLPGARFSHVYGSTEINVCTSYHLPKSGDFPTPLPIGRACSTSSTRVVDEELRPVPEGGTGELLVRGATVMSGYWGDAERNRRVLVQQPCDGDLGETYFRTGDRVQTLADGNLAFVARADLQVKVRGFRVELGEVETALLSLDAVEEAAAFTVPDGEGSSALRAAVVVGPEAASAPPDATARELREDLRQVLPAYAVPAELDILGSMPRTPTGKVDRKALIEGSGRPAQRIESAP